MSLTSLSTLQFNYNLTGLDDINTGEGNVLPVSSGSNITVVNDTTQYIVNLNDDIAIDTITAGTGTFSSIISTNYTGGTGTFNNLLTNQIQFNTNYTPATLPPGILYFSNEENRNTLATQLDADVDCHIGEDMFFRVKATENIPKGRCVQFDGTLGASGILLAKIATGTNLIPEYMMGIASETITKNDFGFVNHFGYIRGVDTSLYPGGTLLYYNGTGGLTNVEPVAPNVKILMCAVINQGNSSNGSIFVRPSLFPSIEDINGVYVSGATSNDMLVYRTNRWVNESVPSVMNNISLTGASIINLTGTNATITNLVSTNFTGTNGRITNLVATTFTGTNGFITNLVNTTFTGSNATINSATIPNLVSTTFTGASSSINNMVFINATGTTMNTTTTRATSYTSNANTNPMLYSINNDTTLSANGGAGTRVYIRPNGYLSTTNQSYFDNNDGRLTTPFITTADMISNNISNTALITSNNVQTSSLGVSGTAVINDLDVSTNLDVNTIRCYTGATLNDNGYLRLSNSLTDSFSLRYDTASNNARFSTQPTTAGILDVGYYTAGLATNAWNSRIQLNGFSGNIGISGNLSATGNASINGIVSTNNSFKLINSTFTSNGNDIFFNTNGASIIYMRPNGAGNSSNESWFNNNSTSIQGGLIKTNSGRQVAIGGIDPNATDTYVKLTVHATGASNNFLRVQANTAYSKGLELYNNQTSAPQWSLYSPASSETLRFQAKGATDRVFFTATGGLALNNSTYIMGYKYPFTDDTYIGQDTGLSVGSTSRYITAVGASAMRNNNSEFGGVAIGNSSCFNQVVGQYNVAVGINSSRFNNTGSFRTAMGHNCMFYPRHNDYDIALGFEAMACYSDRYNPAGFDSLNVAIGVSSMGDIQGTGANAPYYNTCVGYATLYDGKNCQGNVLMGHLAGRELMTGCNSNVAIGTNAMRQGKESKSNNTYVGAGAGFSAGTNNTSIGYESMRGTTTTASYNTCLGLGAGYNVADNNIMIGYNAYPGTASQSNKLIIGDANYGIHGTELYSAGFKMGINKFNPTAQLDVVGTIRATTGGAGIYEGYDENHAIHMRFGGTNIMRFYEFGDYEFYNNGLKASQALRFKIDTSGYSYFYPKTINAFNIISTPYVRGVGESFSYSQGSGAYKPYSVATFSNQAYTVAGGLVKAQLTATSNTNHSAFSSTTDDVLCDWKGLYQVHININLSNLSGSTTAVFLKLYKNAGAVESGVKTLINGAVESFNMTTVVDVNATDALSFYIQPDSQNVSIINDSTFRVVQIA
jgi:hypothetical protein